MELYDLLKLNLHSPANNIILLSTAFFSRSLLSAPFKFVINTLAPMETAVFCPPVAPPVWERRPGVRGAPVGCLVILWMSVVPFINYDMAQLRQTRRKVPERKSQRISRPTDSVDSSENGFVVLPNVPYVQIILSTYIVHNM